MTPIIIIASIIALILIIALIIGTKLTIERSVAIRKPLDSVFNYLRFVKNQDNFSVWNMADPEMAKEYRGTDGKVGFVYAWNSPRMKNVGAGEQEIMKIDEGKNIEHEVRFFRPMQNTAKVNFAFKEINGNTEVQWGFYGKMKFPMNIAKAMFQKMLGRDLEKGLQNLKVVLEKQ